MHLHSIHKFWTPAALLLENYWLPREPQPEKKVKNKQDGKQQTLSILSIFKHNLKHVDDFF